MATNPTIATSKFRTGWQGWLEKRPAYALAAILLVVPLIIPEKTLATEILTFGLFATSLNLLLGYTGLLSFGHSTFLGLGAYTAALFMIRTGIHNIWLALLAAVIAAIIAGVIIGWFCLRQRMVYFAMLTLAFNQMVYFIFLQWQGVTGGDDGLRGIPIPPLDLPGMAIAIDKIHHPYEFYYFVFFIVVICLLMIQRIIQSPFGRALQAIRESEERAKAIGYNTNRLQLLSFVFASMFAGVAGGLNALFFGFVGLETLSWVTAGTVVLMTILGGRGTFVGPFLGAGVYLIIQEYASKEWQSWPLILGAIFVLIVLFLPQGLWGTFKEWMGKREATKRQSKTTGPASYRSVEAEAKE